MDPVCQKKQSLYARRRPELSTCYRILPVELAIFIADREAEGRPLPDYVLDEFEAYMKCGILAHSFLHLNCQDCEDEKIVEFFFARHCEFDMLSALSAGIAKLQ